MNRARSILLMLVVLLFIPVLCGAAEFDGETDEVISAVLVDAASGGTLYEKEPDKRVYPGSTTKLMTALLLVEQKGLDGEVTAGEEVNKFGSSSTLMQLHQYETVTVRDLLYGLLLPSGNDAAATIAVYVSGSEDAFCELMNERARELGMVGTNFVNPSGLFLYQDENNPLPEEKLGINHYTTAADMARLAVEVHKHPEIMEVVGTAEYTLSATNKHEDERGIHNYNALLYANEGSTNEKYLYQHATGMKTGLIQNISADGEIYKAYGSLVASAEQDGHTLIALIFGDHSEKTDEEPSAHRRWELAAELFAYGFQNHEPQEPTATPAPTQEPEATPEPTVAPLAQSVTAAPATPTPGATMPVTASGVPWWVWVIIAGAAAVGVILLLLWMRERRFFNGSTSNRWYYRRGSWPFWRR